jgi:hypothetical protein
MPTRGEDGAPSFSPDQPRELRRYFKELSLLFICAQVTDDEEKKIYACRYLDVDSAELWESLPKFEPGEPYLDFVKAIYQLYPGSEDERKWTVAAMENLVSEHLRSGIRSLDDLGRYYRAFRTITKFLRDNNRISEAEQSRAFVRGFQSVLWDRIARRLELKFPDHYPDEHYPFEQVHTAAKFVLHGTAGSAVEFKESPTSTPAHPAVIKGEELSSVIDAFLTSFKQKLASNIRASPPTPAAILDQPSTSMMYSVTPSIVVPPVQPVVTAHLAHDPVIEARIAAIQAEIALLQQQKACSVSSLPVRSAPCEITPVVLAPQPRTVSSHVYDTPVQEKPRTVLTRPAANFSLERTVPAVPPINVYQVLVNSRETQPDAEHYVEAESSIVLAQEKYYPAPETVPRDAESSEESDNSPVKPFEPVIVPSSPILPFTDTAPPSPILEPMSQPSIQFLHFDPLGPFAIGPVCHSEEDTIDLVSPAVGPSNHSDAYLDIVSPAIGPLSHSEESPNMSAPAIGPLSHSDESPNFITDLLALISRLDPSSQTAKNLFEVFDASADQPLALGNLSPSQINLLQSLFDDREDPPVDDIDLEPPSPPPRQ